MDKKNNRFVDYQHVIPVSQLTNTSDLHHTGLFGQHVVGVKYRVSDTYPAGYDAIWDRSVSKELEFNADAQGSAVAA